MPEEKHRTPRCLTDSQSARLDYARQDLESARSEDLAQLQEDGLILMVEKLRRRLDDVLRVADEVTQDKRSQC